MITIGELDTPVQLQEVSFSANANYGGIQDETWASANQVAKVWAYLIFKGGN